MKLRLLLGLLTFQILPAQSFGVDVCYNDPTLGPGLIRNCIGVEEACRTSNLPPAQQVSCRQEAFTDSLSGLSGTNGIIGGRSLVHGDSTYLMAQLIGYTPWEAYQIMMYNEATDQKYYLPFDQLGRQIMDDGAIRQCRENWGPTMPRDCLIATKEINGVYKFNNESGGMLLHLHARYSPDGNQPPSIGLPANYFSPAYAPYEPLLTNLQDWAMNRREDACVAGILVRNTGGAPASIPCEARERMIKSPQNVFALGVPALQIPFYSNLGRLIINEDEQGQVLATDSSFQNFLTPHQVEFAKLGVFLHAYVDRVSHHMCIDRSWFEQEASGDYISDYDQVYCAQGSHFLWHAWEQGTDQSSQNIDPEFQTIRPALQGVLAQLLEHARLDNRQPKTAFSETDLINELVDLLGLYDPEVRLSAMVDLMESYAVLPLLGHGSAANLTIDQWLDQAGAPTLAGAQSAPGPLPVLGACSTFLWSRTLRRRIKASLPAHRSDS